MKYTRYLKLSQSNDEQLTEEEEKEGWHFCDAEWDGMLIHDTWDAAECCSCKSTEVTDKTLGVLT